MSLSAALQTALAAASGPLPAAAGDAAEVRDGEAFDSLQGQVERMQRDGPAAVDWPAVAEQGLALLAQQSKDVLVAAWAAHALHRTQGLAGLAGGLELVQALVETFWEELYPPPKRMRARAAALEWLAQRSGALLQEVSAKAADAEALSAALAALEAIDKAAGEKAPDAAFSLSELLRPLQPLTRQAATLWCFCAMVMSLTSPWSPMVLL